MSDGLKLLTSIVENGSTTSFRLLEPELFRGDEETNTYNFIRNHFRRHSEFPTPETVQEELNLRLPDTPETVDFYLEKVNDRALYNRVQPIFGNLRQSLIQADAASIRENISMLSSAARRQQAQSDLLTAEEVGEDVLSAYARAHRTHGLSGITTGFQYLDQQSGGYQNGDLIVWVARPGVGKTHMLIHQAKAAYLAGKSILFVSMEMTLTQIGNRFYGQMAGVDPDLIRKGRLSRWGFRRLEETVYSMDGSNRFSLYAGNMQKRVEDLDILIQELNPDCIYLDGMYLMSPRADRKRGNSGRFERAAYLLDDIKEMTIMRNRPIVATTQFGRAAEKGGKKGSLENIGYTDAIGTHSSIVIGTRTGDPVLRTVKSGTGSSAVDKTLLTFPVRYNDIMKGREGEVGSFATNFKLTPVDFSQATDEEARFAETDARPNLDHME